MHREVLVEALWPDADPGSSANRLYQAAHFVRRASGRVDTVVLDGTTVALFPDTDVPVDAAEFERPAGVVLPTGDQRPATGDRQALGRAADRYTGDLLPYDLSDEWAFHRRQRLQLQYCDVLRAPATTPAWSISTRPTKRRRSG